MLFLSLFLVVGLLACGPPPMPPASVLDTAQNQYRAGLARLEAGDLAGAQRAFDRAGALNPNFAGAYVGSALTALARKDYPLAHAQIQVALRHDDACVDAYLTRGRLIAAEGEAAHEKPESWLPAALRDFSRAEKLAPGDPRVPYYSGVAYRGGLDLDAAQRSFKRVLQLGGSPWDALAARDLDLVQQAERAAPGSLLGRRIALRRQISRAELAVLLVDELRLPELMRRRAPGAGPGSKAAFASPAGQHALPGPEPEDVRNSWARPWIEQVLQSGFRGLQCFPDGSFQPDAPVTRADYAVVVEELIVLLSGDTRLRTRYVGEPSRFADVRSDFYAYNAIALVTERGLMSLDPAAGTFRPQGTITGAEALLLMRDLQREFRMEF